MMQAVPGLALDVQRSLVREHQCPQLQLPCRLGEQNSTQRSRKVCMHGGSVGGQGEHPHLSWMLPENQSLRGWFGCRSKGLPPAGKGL